MSRRKRKDKMTCSGKVIEVLTAHTHTYSLLAALPVQVFNFYGQRGALESWAASTMLLMSRM